jgi:RHS repeat-associated protein
LISYTYDDVGNRLTRSVEVGSRVVTTTYVYDANDRLTSETEGVTTASTGGSDEHLALPLYALLIGMLLVAGTVQIVHRRRKAGREDRRPAGAWGAVTHVVALVLVGHLIVEPNVTLALPVAAYPGEAAVAAAPGEVVVPQTYTYGYDTAGNMVTRHDGSATDVYTYDSRGHLVQADVALGPEPGLVSYVYDAAGARVRKVTVAATTDYLVDHNQPFAQVVRETTGTDTTSYVHGDDLISRSIASAGVEYYVYDGNMSVRQLTDPAGTVVDTYTYDAFGVPLHVTGNSDNAYLYTGEQFDPNLGFYYLRARYYSPPTGRFLSMDTFAGVSFDPPTLHKYAYVANSPIDRVDPSGRFFGGIGGVMAAIAIASIVIGIAILRTNTVRRWLYGADSIYLDFSAMKTPGYNKAVVQNHAEEMVTADYSPWTVKVTTTAPSGSSKHVHFAGHPPDGETWFGVVYGVYSDDAYVFTEHIAEWVKKYGQAQINMGLGVGNTASHEAGHALGLNHVEGGEQIMRPTGSVTVDETFATESEQWLDIVLIRR